jgi:hypothetical protein
MVKDGSEYFKICIPINSNRTLVTEIVLTEITPTFETLYHSEKKLVSPYTEGLVSYLHYLTTLVQVAVYIVNSSRETERDQEW